jgi:hypothetical protein
VKNAYEVWIGQFLALQMLLGRDRFSLRGVLLKENRESLLIKPEHGADIEIPKTWVLAIEELPRSNVTHSCSSWAGLS